MSTGQRLVNVLTGLLMLALSVALIADPGIGIPVIAAILSASLSIYGLRYFFFYFTMARHMVGGKLMLFVGIIALDLGAFTATLVDTPRVYIILYLLVMHAFSGGIDVLRGLEARRGGSPSWRLSVAHGAVNIAVALACVVFLRSTRVLVCVYAAGLVYSALVRIVTAFRRTAIVYVQ
jgi:uncharacterized membrane protein HdeD (DUF308 family)